MTAATLFRYWWVLALAALLALVVTQTQRNQIIHADLKASQARLATAEATLRKTLRSSTVTASVSAKVERRQVEIRHITRTLIEKVPVYVTAEADRRYPLPVGLVRLHDEAASGSAPVSGGSGELDDTPSQTPPSALAATLAANYGDYYACREQVMGWIDWYNLQRQNWNSE